MSKQIDTNSEKTWLQNPAVRQLSGSVSGGSSPHCPSPEEQQIYEHFLHLVRVETPDQMINRCRALFVEGAGYPESGILLILDKITASKNATEEFNFFLNRCCHIIINYWHLKPLMHDAIPDLISLFELSPSKPKTVRYRYKEIRRLRELVKLFTKSEQYIILCRFAEVMSPNPSLDSSRSNQPLKSFIRRYPYLYEHYLMGEESTFEQKQTVKHIQAQVQRKFEIDLSQYVTYKVRQTQTIQRASILEANRILRPVSNPTLLSDSELNTTLKQFICKVEGHYTYKDLAQQFVIYSSQVRNYRAFKHELYEYLVSSIDREYGKKQFNQRLYKQIQNILPYADDQKLDEFLIVRTCSQLLNFLVVNSHLSPQHFIFLDLITHQGTVMTIGLLLKLILICRKVKPYLEKRLSILFHHYESSTASCIQWLVKVLEQLNVALTIHFGNLDLSFFKPYAN